jgi:hypothetical protein
MGKVHEAIKPSNGITSGERRRFLEERSRDIMVNPWKNNYKNDNSHRTQMPVLPWCGTKTRHNWLSV